MKASWLIFFLFIIKVAFPQVKEFTGAIIIGKAEVMSYRIVYTEDRENRIAGQSISDLGGAGETKAQFEGSYNSREKTLRFTETSVTSTKTGLSPAEFCLMNVSGRFIKKDGRTIFKGSFTSKSINSKLICDSGSIVLIPSKEYFEVVAKAAAVRKKIPVPDSLKPVLDEKLSPFDGVERVREVVPGSLTEYNLLADTVQLDILDDKLEDGDKISIYQNNRKIVQELTITNKVKTLRFATDPRQQVIVFTITALNEGSSPPNTVKAVLTNGDQKDLIIAQLREGQYIKLMLKRR